MQKEVILYFDGGIRQGLIATGFLAVSPDNEEEILFSGSRMAGKGTSNIAEYQALIDGLRECLKNNIVIVHVIGDSQLIVKQMTGVFKTQKPELQSQKNIVMKLLDQLSDYSIKWVPRTDNRRADKLVNQAFDKALGKKCNIKQKRKQQRKKLLRRQR